MNRVGAISKVSSERFYELVDVLGLDDFIRDVYLQEPKVMIGKIIFSDEERVVKDYVKVFFEVSDYYPNQAPTEKLEPLIRASKDLYHVMSERGEIELLP